VSTQESMLVVSAHAADFAWRAGKTLEEIKALRQDDASRAAAALGADIEFLDAGDYPLRESDELVDRVVGVYRRVNPMVVLTHPRADLWEYYTDLARRRGTQLRRNAGPNLGLPQSTMAEAYMRVFPQVTDWLS